VSTEIPFENPNRLTSFGLGYGDTYGWGILFDSIELLTLDSMTPSHLNGTRMPLGHRPLTDDERKEIKKWIEQPIE